MAVVWFWARRDVARRLRTLLALAVLIALAAGVAMAAVAGARRDGTAYARLLATVSPSDVWVLPNLPGFDWNSVRGLPEVKTVGEFPVSFYNVVGDQTGQLGGFPPASPESMRDVERPFIVEGRMPEPTRADEVLMTPATRQLGYHVGQTVMFQGYRADKIDEYFSASGPDRGARPDGPLVSARIVGVGKGSFFAGLDPQLEPTLAFFQKYRANILPSIGYINAVVKLRRGPADIPALQADLLRLVGHPVELRDVAADAKRTTHSTDVERDALLAFAAAAGLAALVLIGQAVVRLVNAAAAELVVLRALGFRSGQSWAALVAVPLSAGVAGSVPAVGVTYALSPLMPIGVGRRLEPYPGFHLDWVVAGGGLALLALLLLGGLGLVGAAQLSRREPAEGGPRRSRMAAAATRLPLPVALGVGLALEPGHGRSRVAVRPALVGAVIGVLGVVGSFTFRAGLDRAAADSGLYGQRFDAMVPSPASFGAATDPGTTKAILAVAADGDVAMVNRSHVVVLSVNGRNVSFFGLQPVKGDFGVATLAGREPRSDDEILIGPQEAKALGVHLGQRVRVAEVVGPGVVDYTVVGVGFAPEDGHTAYDQGGWMTEAGLGRVVHSESQFKFFDVLVRFRSGVNKTAVLDRLNNGPAQGNLQPAGSVSDQANLAGVRRVPVALGGFLVLLAVAAVGHALATAVRRRQHDVAVLRVLGMTPGQTRACVASQASTLALVGLVIGIPVGVAAGRTMWRVVARSTPMLYVAPLAALAALLVVPGAMCAANALSLWPARLAARLRPAAVLRSE